MLSLTIPTQVPSSNHRVSHLNARVIPVLFFSCNSHKRDKNDQKSFLMSFGLTEDRRAYKFGRNLDDSWCFRCHKSDGDADLEAEIMSFMAESEKPTMFPTEEELVRAGRLDLVISIKNKGGWYSLGWDDENVGDDVEETTDSDIAEFQRRIESCKQSSSSSFSGGAVKPTARNLDSLQISLDTSPQLPSGEDSGEPAANEDSGIDGILSRLTKQRTDDLMGIKLGKDRYEAHSKSEDEGDDKYSDTSLGFGSSHLEGNGKLSPTYHHNGTLDSSGINVRHYTEPETWRSWSSRRAGSQHTEFEAAEISFDKSSVDADEESYHDGITITTKEYGEKSDEHQEIDFNEIQSRLQYLKSELTTVLQSVRSNKVDGNLEEVTGSSSELHNLSDKLEFQENEVMSAKEALRSLRAKVAILEGKMTLARINAKNTVELKYKRLDDARKSLQLLRSTSIVWHNSAKEVFVAGSFDGWMSQRRMQKSKSGVFSITLKLYPGVYEIKFIVDGQWKVDPLRPIVNNNGYQNNLFKVT